MGGRIARAGMASGRRVGWLLALDLFELGGGELGVGLRQVVLLEGLDIELTSMVAREAVLGTEIVLTSTCMGIEESDLAVALVTAVLLTLFLLLGGSLLKGDGSDRLFNLHELGFYNLNLLDGRSFGFLGLDGVLVFLVALGAVVLGGRVSEKTASLDALNGCLGVYLVGFGHDELGSYLKKNKNNKKGEERYLS